MSTTPQAAELSIGEIARRAAVRASTIRFYERTGLLPEPRRVSGRRRYEESVLRRLEVIDAAKRSGFSLSEIRTVLDRLDPARPASEQWRPFAQAKLRELDARASELEAMRALLRRGVQCRCLSAEDCELLGRATAGEPHPFGERALRSSSEAPA